LDGNQISSPYQQSCEKIEKQAKKKVYQRQIKPKIVKGGLGFVD
jgi:hypothetical protein